MVVGGANRARATCGQHLHVRNETQSSARLPIWGNRKEITFVFAVIAIRYSRGRKQLESGFAGNIVVNIEG